MNSLKAIHRFGAYNGMFPGALSQVRHYAARKGTREKMRKKKVKVEVKKLTLAEKIKRHKKVNIVKPDMILYNFEKKLVATDDVYYRPFYQWKIYSFAEAIESHREYFHPTMFNMPDTLVNIYVELNMQGVKKTKPVETFHSIVPVRHNFDHGEVRQILVFCKTENEVKEVLDNGAALAGGSDIIKLIMSGEISVSNYDTVIAHPSMMPEILTIRGLLKKKHPTIKQGTVSPDLKTMLNTHLRGIKYTAKPYDHYPEYGQTTIPIGTLDMPTEHLEDNLQDAVDSIMKVKPKRPGFFITRIRVECPSSKARLKIDHTIYTKEESSDNKQPAPEEEEDDNVAVAVPVS
ncbi:large ribosomal subunit protein uL1m isoform X2 [Phymastichus coffea]|nr:large ribosomal subunit protein uL1m isoform X2 [Phymastichus coffea]